jgi:plastocyanin
MHGRTLWVLGAALVLSSCGSSGSGSTSTSTAPTTVTTTPTGSGSTASASVDVPAPDASTGEYGQGKNEAQSSFTPSNITVTVGGTVTWTNHDVVAHTSTSTTGAWNGSLSPGATFSRAFPTAGTFDYRCTIHPTMAGTITVK